MNDKIMMGFYSRLLDCRNPDAELQDIFKRQNLILEHGHEQIEVESDSEVAMKLQKEELNPHFPNRKIMYCRAQRGLQFALQ